MSGAVDGRFAAGAALGQRRTTPPHAIRTLLVRWVNQEPRRRRQPGFLPDNLRRDVGLPPAPWQPSRFGPF